MLVCLFSESNYEVCRGLLRCLVALTFESEHSLAGEARVHLHSFVNSLAGN